MRPLRFALRSLLRHPSITLMAVLSLALGIGANAAIFSLFEQVLLRPLPVDDPQSLVHLGAPGPKPGSHAVSYMGGMDDLLSYPMFRDLEEAVRDGSGGEALVGLAAQRDFAVHLGHGGEARRGLGLMVSGDYFPILGLRPAAGRLLSPADDLVPEGQDQVVLSHDFWQRRFAGDPAVVGDTLTVNGATLTVVGVAPAGFRGTSLGSEPDVFVPLAMRGTMVPAWKDSGRLSYWLYAFGRLRPGADAEDAEKALGTTYRAILQDVEMPLQTELSAAEKELFPQRSLVFAPGAQGRSLLRGELEPPLRLLLAATMLVLLIAVANLTNLLLVRVGDQTGDMAVRLSIGARRSQLVAQSLAESFLLVLVGAAAGWWVALISFKGITHLLPVQLTGLHWQPSLRVWLFTGALVALIGCVGLLPALHGLRGALGTALRSHGGRRTGSRSAAHFRSAMVVVQIALSVALLGVAGLFIKSLAQIGNVDTGLEIDQLTAFVVAPRPAGYDYEQSRALFEQLERGIAALPGVTGVAASRVPVLAGESWGSDVTVEGFDAGPDTDVSSFFSEVGPGFHSVVGMELLAGRGIEVTDDGSGRAVAVVNETFVRKFGLGADAVGKRFNPEGGPELTTEIVGIVRDAAYNQVKGDVPPVFYLPYRQNPEIGHLFFYLRSELQAETLAPSVRRLVSESAPGLPPVEVRSMSSQLAENVAFDRLLSSLSSVFALIATLLAAVGLYGVTAYSVAKRRREIGLRMALGADGARIRRWVLGRIGVPAGVGVALGLAAALGLGRLASSLLFGIRPDDPSVLAAAALTVIAVSLMAGFFPARRATLVDPVEALGDD